MPSKNPAAVLLGRLSGLSRGSPPDIELLRLSKRQKHKAAVALGALGKEGGRAGGLVGGPARAAVLSAKKRRSIAKKAAKARWTAQKKQHKKICSF
jgi:hypothetical protein